jgi:hypothetical protein
VRVRSICSGSRLDDEAREEIRAHFDRQVDLYLVSGLSPAETRRAAVLHIGRVAQAGEGCRDARGRRR